MEDRTPRFHSPISNIGDGRRRDIIHASGGVSEWIKETVLKTVVGSTPTVGSNPTPSAILNLRRASQPADGLVAGPDRRPTDPVAGRSLG